MGRLIAKPDYDPENPYHYHTPSGEKVVVTPEDWEKYKDDPAFKNVRAAIEVEHANYPEQEYEVNPVFLRDLRSTYSTNMGNGYQNYRYFGDSLPEGYSFTDEGIIIGPDGTAYVQSGYRQSPRFTYNENNPLQFTINKGKKPIEKTLTFYPVNMDKKPKEPLPVDRVMNVGGAKQKAEEDNMIFLSGLDTDRVIYFPDWSISDWFGKPAQLSRQQYKSAIDFAKKEGADSQVLQEFNKAGKWIKGKSIIPLTENQEQLYYISRVILGHGFQGGKYETYPNPKGTWEQGNFVVSRDKSILEQLQQNALKNRKDYTRHGEFEIFTKPAESDVEAEFAQRMQKAFQEIMEARQRGESRYFSVTPDEGTVEHFSLENTANYIDDYKKRKRLQHRED